MTNKLLRVIDGLTPARLVWLLALYAAAALLLAACTQQTPPEEEPPPDPALELALDQAAILLLRGGTATLEVEITRVGGADDPASLGLDGALPAGVRATFDPPELSGTQLTSKLTLAAEPDAEEATIALEVVVKSGELNSSQGLTLEIAGLDVVGRLEDPFGQPLGGGRAGSQGQTVVVNADGSFTLHDLSVPYDLMVGSGREGRLHLFEGMTDPAPLIVPYHDVDIDAGASTTTISGLLLEGDPLGPNEAVTVCAEGHDVVVFRCLRASNGVDDYLFEPYWHGDGSQKVTLHAIHYEEGPDDETTAYLGYDSLDVTLVDGVPATWDIEFERIGTSFLEGRVERGAGVVGGRLLAAGWVRIGKTLSFQVNGVFDDPDFSLLMPDLPARSPIYDLLVADGHGGDDTAMAWRSEVGGDVGEIALLDIPQVSGPSNGEVGISLATPFAVAGLEGQVKTFAWSGASGGPMIALTTTRDEVTIPDPAVIGLPGILRSGAMDWGVSSSTSDDVDGAADEFFTATQLVLAILGWGPMPPDEGSVASVHEREFFFGLPP